MNKRIIFIILGALAFAALLALLWMWFFSGAPAAAPGGTFGEGADKGQTTQEEEAGGNIAGKTIPDDFGLGATGTHVGTLQDMLVARGFMTRSAGSQRGTFDATTQQALMAYQSSIGLRASGYVDAPTAAALNGRLPAGTGTGPIGGGTYTPRNIILNASSTGLSYTTGTSTVADVNWLASGNANLSTFVPSGINDLNNGQVGGQVALFGTPPAPNTSDNSLNAGLFAAAGIAGAVACTPGLLGSIVGASVSTGVTITGAAASVPVIDIPLNTQTIYANTLKSSDTYKTNFLDCITRVWAKVILQQITNSVVNWINSGFNGQPAFVTNYNQFFNNVANQAAGEFIKGSSLSFLCSPFQAQIRLAIARSYAQRNAQSCTFTSIMSNLTKFTGGNFAAGGWKGLISLNTMPTNNPYGAYMYGQIGLSNAQSNALRNSNTDLINGRGFLSFKKEECTGPLDPLSGNRTGCTTKIATPGSTIADSLTKTLGVGQDSLNMAKSFDEIISALLYQLMTRVLQNGLSSVSGTNGYAGNYLTPDQQAAQGQGNTLLTSLQNVVQVAQQYGTVKQASARDIQTLQQQYLSLQNCWESASSSPAITAAQRAQATQNAAAASANITTLEGDVATLNADIAFANSAIALLQDMQTQTLRVGSTADVTAVQTRLATAQSSNLLVLPADLTLAQQDRTTLQTRLGAASQEITAGLQQCYALGN